MHTVEQLEQALALAEKAGFKIRQEYLGGEGGGACEFGGAKWIFLDLALTIPDQLGLVLDALREDPHAQTLPIPPRLQPLLRRKAS